jgi:hypothetical protein
MKSSRSDFSRRSISIVTWIPATQKNLLVKMPLAIVLHRVGVDGFGLSRELCDELVQLGQAETAAAPEVGGRVLPLEPDLYQLRP